MPVQKGVSGVTAKLKAQGAGGGFDKHKNDETNYGGGGEIPEGIEGGVAQLVEAKIDEYKTGENKGKLYMQLRGVCVFSGNDATPDHHLEPMRDGKGVIASYRKVKVTGMQVMKQVALHPNPKAKVTMDDAIGTALNEMRKMGVATGQLAVDDMEAALAALKMAAPHFNFRTWRGKPTTQYPNPRTNTQFKGVCDFNSNGQAPAASGVEDNTGSDAPADEPTPDAIDWMELAGKAGDDADIQAQFITKGAELGISEEAITNAESWEIVAQQIMEAEAGNSGEAAPTGTEAEANTEWKPAKGDEYEYKKRGARNKKWYEVTAVFAETVNLKEKTDDGKGETLKGVKWSNTPAPNLDGQNI